MTTLLLEPTVKTKPNAKADLFEMSKASSAAKPSRSRRRATAESLAAQQRDISVSEFFAKNRHLLGFDNPRKALLTTVKEAVDKDKGRWIGRGHSSLLSGGFQRVAPEADHSLLSMGE